MKGLAKMLSGGGNASSSGGNQQPSNSPATNKTSEGSDKKPSPPSSYIVSRSALCEFTRFVMNSQLNRLVLSQCPISMELMSDPVIVATGEIRLGGVSHAWAHSLNIPQATPTTDARSRDGFMSKAIGPVQ